jgi:ElaB/YqjD/DUF883 family membrane-anchored ribosome-binding protein
LTTPQDAYRKAANSPAAREAAETARSMGEQASEFAADMSDKAGRQFSRAQDRAVDAFDEAHEAARRNPLAAMAIALGIGFLFGAIATSRR